MFHTLVAAVAVDATTLMLQVLQTNLAFSSRTCCGSTILKTVAHRFCSLPRRFTFGFAWLVVH